MPQNDDASRRVAVRRYPGGSEVDDPVVIEEPLEIVLEFGVADQRQQKTIAITMRTPGDDVSLAAGFLFTEGVVSHANDLLAIKSVPGKDNAVLISLAESLQPDWLRLERNFYTTSSCGVCGKTSLDAIEAVAPFEIDSAAPGFSLSAEQLSKLPQYLAELQTTYESTGGIHAAALFDADGHLLDVAEDVGRHNAVDKLIGKAFLAGRLPLSDTGILLSGRAGFELVQKARMAASPLVVAIGAPSTLAIDLAWESGMTLVGFVSAQGLNVYSCPGRLNG